MAHGSALPPVDLPTTILVVILVGLASWCAYLGSQIRRLPIARSI
jgi:hypothetical protein